MIGEKSQIKNSKILIFIFLGVVVFQLTLLRFIWSIENFSRVYNAFTLLVSVLFAFHLILSKGFSKSIWRKFLIPGVLVFSGMSLNILISAMSNPKLLGQLGLTIPWALFMMMPYLVNKGKINVYSLWNLMYYVMLVLVILGLIDYYLIYISGMNAEVVKTPYGPFHIGSFSILYPTYNGPHFRFYASFPEPGTLAMFLLPFIVYSFLKKRYFGLFVFLIAFYLTYSLGGYIGLVLISFLVYVYKTKKIDKVLSIISAVVIIGVSYSYLSSSLLARYERKGGSAMEREKSFFNGVAALPNLMVKYPLGMPLAETTEGLEANREYTGSNFIPIMYFQSGGIMSFLGYVLVLITSLKFCFTVFLSKRSYRDEYVVASCTLITMVPFLLQRTTIWESGLFALLFVPLMLNVNKIKNEI